MKITELKPAALWGYFADICAIPHPSGHEEKIREYIVAFAKKHRLDYTVDEANNVIVRKPATAGMEGRKMVVLQSHLDMVPQANSDRAFDFTKDPIEPLVDGDWVRANGTTLGADNGIGVAAMLAVLESADLRHGPLEALFTATEETGMVGAFGLEKGELKGQILLNLDTEEDGELCVGCAGGTDANITLPYAAERAPQGYKALEVVVKGLKGGHSGTEIHLGRANANKLLFRTLLPHLHNGVLLSSVDGGGLRNAIPREAKATILVAADYFATFTEDVAGMEKTYKNEYKNIEDSLSITVLSSQTYPLEIIPVAVARNLAAAVCVVPNGIMAMSAAMSGLVQTSSNFARVVSDGKSVKMQALVRGSVRSEKEFTAERIATLFSLIGADTELSGSYDGWNPDMSSPILATMSAAYEKLFGKKPHVAAVHAGLECGIIGGVCPGMDMISFGPTIKFPHSPGEQVHIESVANFWKFLTHTLENI